MEKQRWEADRSGRTEEEGTERIKRQKWQALTDGKSAVEGTHRWKDRNGNAHRARKTEMADLQRLERQR